MRFSLIIATVERITELSELLQSVELQNFCDLEVIIVDQNTDFRLKHIVEEVSLIEANAWIRSSVKNNSHARNIGSYIARGDIIAFPDDDCMYPPELLTKVDQIFSTHPDIAFLTGPSVTGSGQLGSGRWYRKSGPITEKNIWTTVTEFNFFVRKQWFSRVNGFDERFGLGAPFGSAEGVDLALRIMRSGGLGLYDFDLQVQHPDKGFTEKTILRSFSYGMGFGRVLKQHKIPLITVFTFFVRPMGGVVISLLQGDLARSRFHMRALAGRLYGYMYRDPHN